MKKEKPFKNIDCSITDEQIKNIFHQSVENINLTNESRNKLYDIPLNTKKQSLIQKLLEKEIVIPLPSLAICTSLAIMLVGIYISNLILINDIPEPKYEIINMQTLEYSPYVSQGKGR